MSHQDIRDVARRYKNLQTLAADPYGIHGKLPAVLENMCCEVFNKGSETITFKNDHPEKANHFFFNKPPAFWEQFDCPPGEWVFLPHGRYIASVPSQSKEIQVVINMGDAMFKGNKLPSRPDLKKMQVFVK